MLAVAIPSGYRLLRSEQHNDASQEAAAAFEDLTWTLSLAVAKLEAAQRAYVAGGQDGERWYAVVDRQLETVVGYRSEGAVHDGGSAHALDSIAAAEITVDHDHLRGIDGIAREHAVSGETLMASDVVFADARELALRATTELAAARSAEQAALTDFEKQRRQNSDRNLVNCDGCLDRHCPAARTGRRARPSAGPADCDHDGRIRRRAQPGCRYRRDDRAARVGVRHRAARSG